MASQLNLLLANSPAPFLERMVLVMDGLDEPLAARLLRTKTVNFFDLEAEGRKAKIRVFAGLHQYTDTPLHGYYLDAGGTAVLPMRQNLCQFCFLRTFSNSRLYVAREGEGTGNQPRTLWGRIAHGRVKAGDRVQLFPSGQHAVVAEVRLAGEVVDQVEAGQSAGVVLDRQLDVSRGDWIATAGTIQASQRFSATLAWLDTEPAVVGRRYWVRHGNRWVHARIAAIESKLDIHTLDAHDAHQLAVNEMGHVVIETQQPLPVEAYASNRIGGSLIIVDPATHRTSGALLVKDAS